MRFLSRVGLCCLTRVLQNDVRMQVRRWEGPAISCTCCTNESDSFAGSNWMRTTPVQTCHSDIFHSSWRFAALSCQSHCDSNESKLRLLDISNPRSRVPGAHVNLTSNCRSNCGWRRLQTDRFVDLCQCDCT